MLLFRSEEHVDRWCKRWQQPRGALLSLEQQWQLAIAWYADRLDFNWKRKTPDEVAAIWAELGFVSNFWELSG